MTDTQVSRMFEMQRGIVQQNQNAIGQFIDVQRTASRAFVDGFERFRGLQQQNAELTRDAVHAYFDALEAVAPDADFSTMRARTDDAFDQFETTQEKTWDGLFDAVENGHESVEESVDTYGDFVDSSFDSFLDAHEAVEADIEDAEPIEFDD